MFKSRSRSQLRQQLADGQSEFRSISAARLPTPAAACRQFHPHPDHGPHAERLRVRQNQIQLAYFFDHGNDGAAQPLGEQCHADEVVVLESVAYDRRFGFGHGDHGEQFRLAASFDTVSETSSVSEDLLDDLALLVHFDRKYASVALPIVVIFNRSGETLVQVLQPVLEDPVETDQHGKVQASLDQSIDERFQVDALLLIAFRRHHQVSGIGNVEISVAPARDFVQRGRIFHGPMS